MRILSAERHLCSQRPALQTELSEVDVPQAKHSGAHKPRATVGRTLSTDMLTYLESQLNFLSCQYLVCAVR
jgi:hypothetical protein